jgi:hypothetical protein
VYSTGRVGIAITIERKGREERKEGQYFSAAFAAFAFQRGVNQPDTLPGLERVRESER